MKYALIGCGRIAVNHIKALRNNNLELVAFCDVDPTHIDILLKKTEFKTNVPRYEDYKQMVKEHPEIELIAIATDSGSHAKIAIYCMECGINIIVEKPMAMSMKDADKMIAVAEKNKVKICVCHQNRFNLAVQEMRKAVEKRWFGKISHGSINVRWNRNKDYYDQAPWRGKWASDGGALMNQCIHGIDLLRWMMGGEVEEVYGQTRQQFHTIEGTVNVFPKNLEETLYLFGEKGTVKLGGTSCNNIDVWDFKEENNDKTGLKEETSNVYGNGHTSLYADMIDSINNDRTPYVDGYAGRAALELVLAIYKSQLTGKPIRLPLTDFSSTDMLNCFKKR